LTCADTSTSADALEIIRHLDAVDFKTFHSVYECRRCIALEPRGRAPPVILRQWDDAMPRWIMMNVVQPRQIRSLECNVALPKLKPHFPSGCVVPDIELSGRLHVKFAQKFPQRVRLGRSRNKMIMIRQDCPGAQIPIELGCAVEQRFQKEI
jgi:hypothetical protein